MDKACPRREHQGGVMPDEVVSALGSIVDITAVGEIFAIRQFGMRGKCHAAVGFTSRIGTEYKCSPLTLRT
jgi:hypothetical protein